MVNAQKVVCTYCGQETYPGIEALSHYLAAHGTLKEKIMQYDFYCAQCDVGNMNEKLFNRHLKTKSHIRKTSGLHYCVLCPRTEKNESDLKYHVLEIHASEEEQAKSYAYYCELCKKGYRSKTNYVEHHTSRKHREKMQEASEATTKQRD